jgi:hypothetical protein
LSIRACSIRQVFEAEDFGENLTPELREQEQRLREKSQSCLARLSPATGSDATRTN